MAQNNRKIGSEKEEQAAVFLENNGYSIIKRNYRCRYGEIDLIVKKENRIIFVEVKYRKNTNNGYPREAVDLKKQEKIRNTALFYISENNCSDMDFRFDVVDILNNNITHIKNAF